MVVICYCNVLSRYADMVCRSCGCNAVFQTATKDSSTISIETLHQICKSVDIPVVAIGGITAANAKPAIEAGCQGVAVVSAIFGVEDATASAQQIRAVIDSAMERRAF